MLCNPVIYSKDDHNPEISVSNSGLITSTCGEASSTHLLSSDDCPSFISDNIASGVNIFGVTGTMAAGGAECITTAYNGTFTVFTSGQVVIPLKALPSDFSTSYYAYGCLAYPEYPLAIYFGGQLSAFGSIMLLSTSNSGRIGTLASFSTSSKTLTITGYAGTLSQTLNTQGYAGWISFYKSKPDIAT